MKGKAPSFRMTLDPGNNCTREEPCNVLGSGLGVRGSGFGIRVSGFGLRASGFGVRGGGSVFVVRGSGFGVSLPLRSSCWCANRRLRKPLTGRPSTRRLQCELDQFSGLLIPIPPLSCLFTWWSCPLFLQLLFSLISRGCFLALSVFFKIVL